MRLKPGGISGAAAPDDGLLGVRLLLVGRKELGVGTPRAVPVGDDDATGCAEPGLEAGGAAADDGFFSPPPAPPLCSCCCAFAPPPPDVGGCSLAVLLPGSLLGTYDAVAVSEPGTTPPPVAFLERR